MTKNIDYFVKLPKTFLLIEGMGTRSNEDFIKVTSAYIKERI